MNDGAPFEAKLQEHLLAVQTAARAAKDRVAEGIAGLTARHASGPAEPPATIGPRSAVNFDEPTTSVTGPPPFDPAESDIPEAALDDEGIPVWEDPT